MASFSCVNTSQLCLSAVSRQEWCFYLGQQTAAVPSRNTGTVRHYRNTLYTVAVFCPFCCSSSSVSQSFSTEWGFKTVICPSAARWLTMTKTQCLLWGPSPRTNYSPTLRWSPRLWGWAEAFCNQTMYNSPWPKIKSITWNRKIDISVLVWGHVI